MTSTSAAGGAPGHPTTLNFSNAYELAVNSDVLHKAVDHSRNIDRAIMLFNQRPKDGIAHLIQVGIIEGDPDSVARWLINEPRVDATRLGEFLGKDTEQSLAILNSFARQMADPSLPMDQALRKFTARFFMPGESQQIFRILDRFAAAYVAAENMYGMSEDNAILLSYALIMLNVDAHSERVKRKMTRQEFIKNTSPELRGVVSYAQLGEMYDRVVAGEFRPDQSEAAKHYAQLARNPKYQKEAISVDLNILKGGQVFTKFGRRGKPHKKFVYLSADGCRLCWTDCTKEHTQLKPSHKNAQGDHGISPRAVTAMAAATSKKAVKHVDVGDITNLYVGSTGTIVFRKHRVDDDLDQRCFSIVTEKRTLDLQAPDHCDISPWLQWCHKTLSDRQRVLMEERKKNPVETLDRDKSVDHRNAELWTREVLRDWNRHWSCSGIVSSTSGSTGAYVTRNRSIFDRMGALAPRWLRSEETDGRNARREFERGLAKQKLFEQAYVLDRGQRYDTAISRKFVELWLEGIPAQLRPKLWPIAAGNPHRIDDAFVLRFLTTVRDLDEFDRWTEQQKVHLALLEKDINSGLFREFANLVLGYMRVCGGKPQADLAKGTGKWSPETLPHGSIIPTPAVLLKEDSHKHDYSRNQSAESLSARGVAAAVVSNVVAPLAAMVGLSTAAASPEGNDGESVTRALPRDDPPEGAPVELPLVLEKQNSVSLSEADQATLRELLRSDDRSATAEATIGVNLELASVKSDEMEMEDGWHELRDQMLKMHKCFILLRPDVGYCGSMCYLSTMFLVSSPSFATALASFVSVVHSYYQLDFYRVDGQVYRRSMKMRTLFFETVLQDYLPQLKEHLDALNMSPNIYFLSWLLTGFTRVLPVRCALRAMDGLLLLGECHVFSVALGILQYYEHELMTAGFEQALQVLMTRPDPSVFDEVRFFGKHVADCAVSTERYGQWLALQRLSEAKTFVLEPEFD